MAHIAYFRALIETAQAELGSKADRAEQLTALKAVHRRFYAVVWEAIATDEILREAGFVAPKLAKERNRRLTFARSNYGTIRRWMRVPEHDLMKLNAQKVTKSQLEKESPPARKHVLSNGKLHKKATKLVDELMALAKQADKTQGMNVLHEAIVRLSQVSMNVKPTTDAKVAAHEQRPLRAGKMVFLPAKAA